MNYDKLQRKLYQNLILAKKYNSFHDQYLKKATVYLAKFYNHIEKQINNEAKIPYASPPFFKNTLCHSDERFLRGEIFPTD